MKYDAYPFIKNRAGHTAFNVAEQRKNANKKDPRRERILDMLRVC